jgi:hypothetical protein
MSITWLLSFIYIYILLIGSTTLVGFRPAQLSLSILSRKVLQSAASGTSNPQLGGEFIFLLDHQIGFMYLDFTRTIRRFSALK